MRPQTLTAGVSQAFHPRNLGSFDCSHRPNRAFGNADIKLNAAHGLWRGRRERFVDGISLPVGGKLLPRNSRLRSQSRYMSGSRHSRIEPGQRTFDGKQMFCKVCTQRQRLK